MRVTCQHCAKALNLADDKVPAGSFQLTCPACKKSFVVGADRVGADRAAAGGAVAGRETPPPATEGGRGAGESAPAAGAEMPSLRPAERDLLGTIVPAAFVVDLGASPLGGLDAELERLGMEDVRHFTSLEDAVDVLADAGAGILVIRMDKASTPPCEPLEPLGRLGYGERRRTFVVLVADNVKSLDGQVAFYLQVNCLINAGDAGRFAPLVRRALLYHLRLYRFWTIESAS